MNPLLRFAVFLGLGISAALGAQPVQTSEGQALMHRFLAQEAERLDSRYLEGITNRQHWEAKRPALHRQYMEMLGLWPLPERTPLNPVVTGVLERDEGFRVEKLHFQSRPGLYVTANFYLPKDAKPGAKLPAVLYVCGHSGKGRDGNKTAFQQHGMWFATHGYACLVIDTLQLGEIAAIHHGTYRHDRWWWQARGYTPAGVECWNGIRALDYLQARPEVDPERLAVTGISGGGAATFWIAAADERVKVAVPVSGLSDLEDYVGEKVVNGHCDCMFLINTFQWPWTHIAALVAPRPMLFENSGHDTLFPMPSNDRIRARLERLYGFYTNRTDRLFDIGVAPGGHEDKPELRLMAYRWIQRFLKNDDAPVTEPELPKFEGRLLRAFPGELPADEINTRIDEMFVPLATNTLPASKTAFQSWRARRITELQRIVFPGLPSKATLETRVVVNPNPSGVSAGDNAAGQPTNLSGAKSRSMDFVKGRAAWLVVLNEGESMKTRPAWLGNQAGDAAIVLFAPRGTGPMSWPDPPPYYVRRSLPLLGRTIDSCRVLDVVAAASELLDRSRRVTIAGRGQAGVIAAYAAVLDPRISEVHLVDPTTTHREGPIFLNVLRVVDVPEALGLLAPRQLHVQTDHPAAFARTRKLYDVAGGTLKLEGVKQTGAP